MGANTVLDEATLTRALDPFIAEGWITGEALLLKSGKEATAYRCAAEAATGQSFFVAKVYRDQEVRGFRNDAVYRAGQYIRDSHMRRAMANKSRVGREFQFNSWVSAEYATLRLLHGAGATVPRPIAQAANAILMEYVGDDEGPAAPLQRVDLTLPNAHRLFSFLLRQVELWLRCDRIHGDLSAYNILYRGGALTVIDFPQAVDPRANPHAFELLARDITNVARYFSRVGVASEPTRLADRMWTRYLRAEL
ncbi:MAG TPA: RIO1 family regulatory kinase/ATPase [Chloroflexota bacterium]|jgi:RIO kinase 1|nr:RIO1 family regulatory kinase/ATPase [Chloroflexota bacterium]